MPIWLPRKRASASSSSRPQVLAGNDDRAGIGPLQPRHHHQQRRFARARRAEQADGLAAPYIQIDVLQDMNAGGAAAEREIDPGSAMALPAKGCPDVSFMFLAEGSRAELVVLQRVRSYGGRHESEPNRWRAAVSLRGASLPDRRCPPPRPPAPVRIVALGDSLTAGYRPAGRRRLRAAAASGARRQRHRRGNRQCRRVRRHRVRRAGAARLVGAGRHRRRHPRTWRQRHAARHRARGHARGARHDSAPPDRAPYRVLLCGMRAAPNLGADYGRAFERDLSRARGQIWRPALSVLSRRRCRRSAVSISTTACIPPPPAST